MNHRSTVCQRQVVLVQTVYCGSNSIFCPTCLARIKLTNRKAGGEPDSNQSKQVAAVVVIMEKAVQQRVNPRSNGGRLHPKSFTCILYDVFVFSGKHYMLPLGMLFALFPRWSFCLAQVAQHARLHGHAILPARSPPIFVPVSQSTRSRTFVGDKISQKLSLCGAPRTHRLDP